MSEPETPVSEAETATPGPDPVPEPRRGRMLLLLALGVAALVALVALVVWVVAPGIERQRMVDAAAVDTYGLERVGWAGTGRFVVVQDFERDGTPVVSAWDLETGTTAVQRGWLWLRTEQAAAAVWLVPMAAARVADLVAAPGPAPYPLTGHQLSDAPAPGLVRWQLDSAAPPHAATEWAPVSNGRGGTAVPRVDPAKGSAPSAVRFRQADGTDREADGWPANSTLDPLGWTGSGTLFVGRRLNELPPDSGQSRDAEFDAYRADGTVHTSLSTSASQNAFCLAGEGSNAVQAALVTAAGAYPVTASDLDEPSAEPTKLLDVPAAEGPPGLLGPAGTWVLVRLKAARGATTYDEIVAAGERRRIFLIPRDDSARWTAEAWQEGAGLVRLGLRVSATGQLQTRVVLYRPGVTRPKTVYKGPRRLTTRGER